MREGPLWRPPGASLPSMLPLVFVISILGFLVGGCGAALPFQELGIMASDISWRTCGDGFKDARFRELLRHPALPEGPVVEVIFWERGEGGPVDRGWSGGQSQSVAGYRVTSVPPRSCHTHAPSPSSQCVDAPQKTLASISSPLYPPPSLHFSLHSSLHSFPPPIHQITHCPPPQPLSATSPPHPPTSPPPPPPSSLASQSPSSSPTSPLAAVATHASQTTVPPSSCSKASPSLMPPGSGGPPRAARGG